MFVLLNRAANTVSAAGSRDAHGTGADQNVHPALVTPPDFEPFAGFATKAARNHNKDQGMHPPMTQKDADYANTGYEAAQAR